MKLPISHLDQLHAIFIGTFRDLQAWLELQPVALEGPVVNLVMPSAILPAHPGNIRVQFCQHLTLWQGTFRHIEIISAAALHSLCCNLFLQEGIKLSSAPSSLQHSQ